MIQFTIPATELDHEAYAGTAWVGEALHALSDSDGISHHHVQWAEGGIFVTLFLNAPGPDEAAAEGRRCMAHLTKTLAEGRAGG
ncbi:MAG: hypothetical protein ACJ74O_05500 [Frankiaceae bacterium]